VQVAAKSVVRDRAVMRGGPVTMSAQDYLKTIYVLEVAGGPVTTNVLADRVGVAAPSVTAMMKRLASDGLVTHLPYRGVRLTARGTAAALRVVRRHRLIEAFLHDVVGVPWDEVHDEAEVLEHVVSDQLEDRTAQAWPASRVGRRATRSSTAGRTCPRRAGVRP
jgi:DtxR family Mn-dependent transcriptional regulator